MLKTLLCSIVFILTTAMAQSQCTLPILSGEQNPCAGSTFSYFIQNIPSNFNPQFESYQWSISGTGYSFVGLQAPGGTSKNILWTQAGAGTHTITVYFTRCGQSFTTTTQINVGSSALAPNASAISGSGSACLNETVTYSPVLHPNIDYTGVNFFWKVIKENGAPEDDIQVTPSGNDAIIAWSKTGNFQVALSASYSTCVPSSLITTSVGVGVPSLPNISNLDAACTNSSSSLLIFNYTTGATYSWSVTGSQNSISGSGPSASVTWGPAVGIYTISVSGSSACGTSQTRSFNISVGGAPTKPVITGPDNACTNTPVTLNVSASTSNLIWTITPSTGFSRNGSTFTFTQANTYIIKVQGLGNCFGPLSDDKTIVVKNPVPQPVLTGPSSLCVNTNTLLTIGNSGSGTDYIWRASSGSILIDGVDGTIPNHGFDANITPTAPGAYTLFVQAVQPPGCPVTVEVPKAIEVKTPLTNSNITDIIGSSSVCQDIYPYRIFSPDDSPSATNAQVLWGVSGGGNVVNNPLTSSITVLWQTPGTYTITANTTNVCGSGPTKTLNVNVSAGPAPFPMFPIQGNLTTTLGTTENYTTAFNPQLSYKWFSTGDVVSVSGHNLSVQWNKLSSVAPQTIILNTNNGTCDSRPTIASVTVGPPAFQSFASIDNHTFGQESAQARSNQAGFDIYPNPANSQVRINLSGQSATGTQLQIADHMGNIVFSKWIESNKSFEVISTENFTPGVYYVEVAGHEGRRHAKLFKE